MIATRPARLQAAVTVLGALRVGLGVVAILAPSLPARPWVGADATRVSATTLARALGARDVALGAGTLLALRSGDDVPRWLAASALADAGDVAATLIGWGERPRLGRVGVLLAAGGGAVTCAALAWRTR